MTSMIRVERFTKRYGNFTAVDNISFDAKQGEVFAFLGPNGSGKTTTMKAGRTPIQSVETTWRNPEVPGGFVKRVEQKIMNGKEQKNMESATLLLEFGTK